MKYLYWFDLRALFGNQISNASAEGIFLPLLQDRLTCRSQSFNSKHHRSTDESLKQVMKQLSSHLLECDACKGPQAHSISKMTIVGNIKAGKVENRVS